MLSIVQGHPCHALGAGRLSVSSNQLVNKTNSLFLKLSEGLTGPHALQALQAMDPRPREFQEEMEQ